MTPAHLPMRAELDALETRMGEVASLLSDMAGALTSYPESIRIVEASDPPVAGDRPALITLSTRDWPTIQELDQLLANWRRLREMADRV